MAATPAVVHLRRKGGEIVEGCDVYIGRAMYRGGWRLPGSKWANPYKLQKDGKNRARVLADYEAHVRGKPELMNALSELGGQRLGCWCAPLPCHGDVLARLYAERFGEPRAAPEDESDDQAPLIPDDDSVWAELGL